MRLLLTGGIWETFPLSYTFAKGLLSYSFAYLIATPWVSDTEAPWSFYVDRSLQIAFCESAECSLLMKGAFCCPCFESFFLILVTLQLFCSQSEGRWTAVWNDARLMTYYRNFSGLLLPERRNESIAWSHLVNSKTKIENTTFVKS